MLFAVLICKIMVQEGLIFFRQILDRLDGRWLEALVANILLTLVLVGCFFVLFIAVKKIVKSLRSMVAHGVIEMTEGICTICSGGGAKMFKCTSSATARYCCCDCMERWIYAQTSEVKGTAHHAKCFNACGEMMTLAQLQEMLPKKSYDKYCSDLTRAMLGADKNVVWCACGTVFKTDCGRNLKPHWHRCEGCNSYVCLGCGDFSKVPSEKKRRKQATSKRRAHKKRAKCNEEKHETSSGSMRCPKCTAEISRTRGCSQMRCTYCDQRFTYQLVE